MSFVIKVLLEIAVVLLIVYGIVKEDELIKFEKRFKRRARYYIHNTLLFVSCCIKTFDRRVLKWEIEQ